MTKTKIFTPLLSFFVFWLFVSPVKSDEPFRVIKNDIHLEASPEEVWEAWTTEAGIQSFFAPAAKISIEPRGIYEIYFLPDAPEGQKGSEGTSVIGFQENRMLNVTWALPPYMPAVRPHHTNLVLRIEPMGDGQSHLYLMHAGWGTGEDWDKAHGYFVTAWDRTLSNLAQRFKTGPIDFEAMRKEFEETGTVSWWRENKGK